MTHNNDMYGYLLVHFKEDPASHSERIFMDVSDGDNPQRWIPLNGGEPMLESTIGTTGVRDPYITRNPETGKYYLLATDLRVFGGDDKGWQEWATHGSTNLVVWESNDLVTWSEPWFLDVAVKADGTRAQLGMAWAPECLWVPGFNTETGAGAFVLYWASTLFPDADTQHIDARAHQCIVWASTTDFRQETYSYGGTFIDTGGNTIDTTMIQNRSSDGTVTTYRISKDNSFGRGIWMDRTASHQWWLPGTQWTPIQEKIGAQYSNEGPGGVEGPAVFAHNDGKKWYLYVDVIPDVGYRPLETDNLDEGWKYMDGASFSLAAHTKHGGVISVDKETYERVTSVWRK